MDNQLVFVAAIAATFIFAGFVKGVTGMGLPTVAMGVLGALISPLAAAGLLIIPSFVTNVWQLAAGGNVSAVFKRFWFMMVAILVGTIAGSSMLTGGNTTVTTVALGAALVLYAGYTLFARQIRIPPHKEPWLSPVVGLVTGLVTGGTGVFVIPAVPYLQALGLEKDELIQSLGLSFTISTIALATGLALRGAYDPGNLWLSAVALVPALAGMWLGQVARSRISALTFRRWFLVALLVLGMEMLLRPIF